MGIVATAVAIAAPARAGAATLTLANGTLTYVAGSGAANNVEVSGDSAQVLVVRRSSTDGDVISNSGCTAVVEGERYGCTGVSQVVVAAGDGADRVDAPALSGVPIRI